MLLHPLKILVHGVIRKGVHGFPTVLRHEDSNTRKVQAQVRGTAKSAVIEAEPGCPNIIVLYVYYTKPVNFISTSTESITWIEKTKYVFSKGKTPLAPIKLLRFKHFHETN